jgi:cytochrome c-type biogenesis protein
MSRTSIFLNSVFFVLGFSVIFSIVGILLQTLLTSVAYDAQQWFARVGGLIIILFGLYLVGLQKERKFRVTKKFSSSYMTSFVFGAAFAVGWTPCVTAALGAILALAATQPSSAFILLMMYTLGLGLPFLAVGLFTAQTQALINKMGNTLHYVNIAFGVVLIGLGILVFTNELSRIANFAFLTEFLQNINQGTSLGGSIEGLSIFNLAISFIAGLVSFLSPCILPLIPGFLSYLGTRAGE